MTDPARDAGAEGSLRGVKRFLWIVMIVAIPGARLAPRYAPQLSEKLAWLSSHGPIIAGLAFAVIAVLIYVSARIFERRNPHSR